MVAVRKLRNTSNRSQNAGDGEFSNRLRFEKRKNPRRGFFLKKFYTFSTDCFVVCGQRVSFVVTKETKNTQRSTFGIPQPSHGEASCFYKIYYLENSNYAPCAKVGSIFFVLHQAKRLHNCDIYINAVKLLLSSPDAYLFSSCPTSICRRF